MAAVDSSTIETLRAVGSLIMYLSAIGAFGWVIHTERKVAKILAKLENGISDDLKDLKLRAKLGSKRFHFLKEAMIASGIKVDSDLDGIGD